MRYLIFLLLFSLPAYAAEGVFAGKDGVPIQYKTTEVENEKGAIVIVSGRSEPYLKYDELSNDLRKLGYSIYIMDHRGQGLSGRLAPNSQVGHVETYEDYVADLKTFVNEKVDAKPHQRKFILAHSMGGLIAMLYVHKYPKDFDSAVLSAPAFSPDYQGVPEALAYGLVSLNCAIGRTKEYAPMQHDYHPRGKFEGNHASHSEKRYFMMLNLFREHPKATLGGSSNRHVQRTIEATREVHDFAPEITLPILLFQAGADNLVKPEGQDYFCSHAKNCKLIKFEKSFHEVLQEEDSIRDEALRDIANFYERGTP